MEAAPDIADRIEAARRALSLPSAGNAQLYGALRDGLRLAAAAPSASPALKREADALAERLDAALRLARTGR